MSTGLEFRHLILSITSQCPLQCEYCCVDSGPWRRETMELRDAVSYVHQAKTECPEATLSFTGGEPFARFSLMRDISREASGLGMWHTAITSASWAKSTAYASERLGELKANGLRTLTISYDSSHAPWIDVERVKNCVRAGHGIGIRVVVAGSTSKSRAGAADALGDWLKEFPGVETKDGAIVPQGRASNIPQVDLLINDWTGKNLACPATGDLLIEANGDAYPCCSTAGDYEFLRLGNAKTTSLRELRSRAENSIWFQMITTEGFAGLQRLVKKYHPTVDFPTHYVGVCHLCQMVFGDDEIGILVRDALRRAEEDRNQAALGLFNDLRRMISA
ncbi:radical SAM/SPASM domain-containing protein [Nocardia spumae]|uniref:radical SAM/SPASM domain-containing protein n=1 Tax=Nocardia spumae TaxID=2887190 RepID=UPI001D13AD53|nr:radical SAM protein [Nocardia spumae]